MMEEKETTRNRIVDAVFANMEEKPIDRVTVKDVCKIANVSKSTFYRYYDSVDDVVKAFQEQIFVRLNSINELYNLTTLSQADTGPTPSVVRVLEILRENGLSHPILVTSAFHMKRSVLNFQKQGVAVEPFPTDYLVAHHPVFHYTKLRPQTEALLDNVTVLQETLRTFVTRYIE